MKARCLWSGLSSAAVVLAALASANVQAQTAATNSGDWSDPLNWDNGVPVVGAGATINDNYTIDVTPGAVVGVLDIGAGAGQTGNLNIGPGADLTPGPNAGIRLGAGVSSAAGHVTMTGGTVTIQGGFDTGLVNGDIIIGDNGTGTWTMEDGTLSVPDEILVGAFNAAADGTLTVNGGSVTVGRGIVAGLFSGKGALNVNGGAVTNQQDMSIGFLGDSKGALKVTDGVVNVNKTLWIGRDTGALGSGALDVSGGTINVAVDLLSSVAGATSSTLTQSGGTINIGQHFIHGLNRPSTYTQTGGAVNVNGANSRLTVAENNTAASWDLQDGSITSTHIFLGDFDDSHGTMTVSGGSIALRGNLNVGAALASNAASNPPGYAKNAKGTLIITGPDATIDVAGNLLADPANNPRLDGDNSSLLAFNATSGGVSIIDVAGVANLYGAVIDFNLLSAFPLGSTFDLITATSISSDYVQELTDVGVVGLSIVAGGNGQILRATLIPEPATLALAALGMVALGLQARKQGTREVV